MYAGQQAAHFITLPTPRQRRSTHREVRGVTGLTMPSIAAHFGRLFHWRVQAVEMIRQQALITPAIQTNCHHNVLIIEMTGQHALITHVIQTHCHHGVLITEMTGQQAPVPSCHSNPLLSWTIHHRNDRTTGTCAFLPFKPTVVMDHSS